MTINVMIIAHEQVGTALIEAATKNLLGELPLPTTVVAVDFDGDPDQLITRLAQYANNLKQQQGLLILTDLFGSTPFNIAQALHHNDQVEVVSGLNLPMLIRVMNYPDLDLKCLAQKAISGGKDGVIQCAIENVMGSHA